MTKENLVHHSLEESPIPLFKAFKCAYDGVVHAITTQRNFKIHLIAALFAIAIAIYFQVSPIEFAIVILCIFSVFACELINTAVESVIDLVSPEWNELAKHAKDCAAGAVLLVSIMSVIIAAFIFIPRMF